MYVDTSLFHLSIYLLPPQQPLSPSIDLSLVSSACKPQTHRSSHDISDFITPDLHRKLGALQQRPTYAPTQTYLPAMDSYHNPYSNDYPPSSLASSSSSSRYRPPPNPTYNPPTLYPLHSTSSGSSIAHAPRPPQTRRLPSNMDGLLDNTDSEISAPPPLTTDPNFDIIDWHPAYQSCQRYFLDHAQHEPGTQALCALINIRLPFQWLSNPITSSSPAGANTAP